MAHTVINGRAVVDWTTGDPEGDRKHILAAYRDFINEIKEQADTGHGIDDDTQQGILNIFRKWNVSTDNQIDNIPRIWIKRPEQ